MTIMQSRSKVALITPSKPTMRCSMTTLSSLQRPASGTLKTISPRRQPLYSACNKAGDRHGRWRLGKYAGGGNGDREGRELSAGLGTARVGIRGVGTATQYMGAATVRTRRQSCARLASHSNGARPTAPFRNAVVELLSRRKAPCRMLCCPASRKSGRPQHAGASCATNAWYWLASGSNTQATSARARGSRPSKAEEKKAANCAR
mmetsp:Transcript_44534/g.123333  ORF Transcript_44534/g.123333 Transcript_44534/m.123333 type:complete len:205 (+) Transcript_44534:629-1243(+)